ncbi:hypothetical protein Taro_012550 [Colocasia esculenta]|uniref:Uncharacterized protein n=1 Tax=Colocasia esculenta TaxID=4460 RepID=A0A843UDA6_COLES|nr:hypothetical protein [Colocasia esculenta]
MISQTHSLAPSVCVVSVYVLPVLESWKSSQMDLLDHHKERETVAMDSDHGGVPLGPEMLRNTENEEQKRAAVHAELQRVNQLPSNSSYAAHRLRVLNKVLRLMFIQDHLSRRGVGAAFCRALSLKTRFRALSFKPSTGLAPGMNMSAAYLCEKDKAIP